MDAALKKLERAEEQIECVRQRKETTLPQSHDEASNYSGSVVPSPEPGDKATTSQEFPWILSEQPPALVSLSTPHSVEAVTELSDVSSMTDVTRTLTTQPYSVTLFTAFLVIWNDC